MDNKKDRKMITDHDRLRFIGLLLSSDMRYLIPSLIPRFKSKQKDILGYFKFTKRRYEVLLLEKFIDCEEKVVIPDKWFHENTIEIIDAYHCKGTYDKLKFDLIFYCIDKIFLLPWTVEDIQMILNPTLRSYTSMLNKYHTKTGGGGGS